jgi:hypothetical protein
MMMASMKFTEMHRALGDLHILSIMLVEYGLLPVPEGRLGMKGRVESPTFWSQTTNIFPSIYLRRLR